MKTKFIIKTKKKRIPRALREQIWIKRKKTNLKLNVLLLGVRIK